ncbi:chemotaxis protein CheY [Halobacterium sp. DL1]|jgi:CheY-like chemotaxis protein|nr:chemotaxis protein CheY [Halobacterium sp. DL1]
MTENTTTVLHVDDDPQFRELARTYLERSNSSLSVLSEPSAGDALERIQERAVDCVVSDYEMGDTDGLEFLELVREESVALPFILFTGKGSEEIAAKAVNAGVDAYHQKKVGTGQYAVLARHVHTLVEKYRAEQRLDYLERQKHIVDGGVSVADDYSTDERAESTSMAVVRAVAAREDVDPVELAPPLADVVDTDAVDALFASQSGPASGEVDSLTLTYRGYAITVDGSGQVDLEEQSAQQSGDQTISGSD